MKITVIDIDSGVETIYDYSKDNWKKSYACMTNGGVYMWCPTQCQEGRVVKTSGRLWAVHKEGVKPNIPRSM